MYRELKRLLEEKGLTIAAAESFTGGIFSSLLSEEPGSSKVFQGGVVAYSNASKVKLLGVKQATLEKFGAVSSEIAEEMCLRVKEKFGADIGVSFTGNAGPEALEDEIVGRGYVGIAFNEVVTIYKLKLNGNRQEVRQRAVYFAIKTIIEKISI